MKAIKTNNVHFSELSQFNDSNSAVLIATTFPEGFDFRKVDEFLSEELGFSKGKNLIGVHFIEGNVKGADGRQDWLLEFDHEEIQFNYIARLKFPDLKWTSDFIYNYQKDYFAGDNHPMDSRSSQTPQGIKYKVFLEKNGKKNFMVLYAESEVDAYQKAMDVWHDMGWEVEKVEEA